MDILQEYQVEFFIHELFGKRLSTVNNMLTGYLADYYTIGEVDRLLSGIAKVEEGTIPMAGGMTQSLYLANITRADVQLYHDGEAWEFDNSVRPNYMLPTSHFKIITEAWRRFLL